MLLSYPRSGNHLVRFFIEFLSDQATYGCKDNPADCPAHQYQFPMKVPFQIKPAPRTSCYHKYHSMPAPQDGQVSELIVIVRNPREALIREQGLNLLTNKLPHDSKSSSASYFAILDYYEAFKGRKLMLFYEDIITRRRWFVKALCEFLQVNNPGKLRFVLDNIDRLYEASHKATRPGREPLNVSSGSLNFYYPALRQPFKAQFDKQLIAFTKNHPMIRRRYGINT